MSIDSALKVAAFAFVLIGFVSTIRYAAGVHKALKHTIFAVAAALITILLRMGLEWGGIVP